MFSKGDPGNSLFAVISGTVKIGISSVDGRNAILNLIGAGEIFGEMSILDGQARSADATANSGCEIFAIDRREFLPFMRNQPELAMKFIELLCMRLRRTSDQVEQVILQNLPGRLAGALIRLTEKANWCLAGRTIAITQQEISEMVGMTRESINKQLRVWAARSWVRLEHGAIVVLDAAPLQALAEAGSDSEGVDAPRRVIARSGSLSAHFYRSKCEARYIRSGRHGLIDHGVEIFTVEMFHAWLVRSIQETATVPTGIGISALFALPILVVIALVALAIIQPAAPSWISEAAQAEFVGMSSPDVVPTQPAMQIRTVKAD